MISFTSVGTARDVGDSAYLIQADGTSILLDAGVHPRREGYDSLPNYDLIKDIDVEAILVSHCHLDHLVSVSLQKSRSVFRDKLTFKRYTDTLALRTPAHL